MIQGLTCRGTERVVYHMSLKPHYNPYKHISQSQSACLKKPFEECGKIPLYALMAHRFTKTNQP